MNKDIILNFLLLLHVFLLDLDGRLDDFLVKRIVVLLMSNANITIHFLWKAART